MARMIQGPDALPHMKAWMFLPKDYG